MAGCPELAAENDAVHALPRRIDVLGIDKSDADLALLIEAWGDLPESVKNTILRTVSEVV